MKKVGRNDPCPCGSGKKYKKCHGASNVIELTPTLYNKELESLHSGFVNFAIEKYEAELKQVTEKYLQPDFDKDQNLMELYTAGLMDWAMMFEPIDNGRTIFEIYYENEQNKIKNERVSRTFESWQEVIPSVYEIVSVTEEEIHLKDARTQKTAKLIVRKGRDFEEGNIIIGVLLPYIQQQDFLFSAVELIDANQRVIKMAETLDEKALTVNYPATLAKALAPEVNNDEIEWDNPLYEEVANIFKGKMAEKEASEFSVITGEYLWKVFTVKESPTFRKPETYAAALEYFLLNEVLGESSLSQKELAVEYGTSPNTISKNAKRMLEVLDEELEEI